MEATHKPKRKLGCWWFLIPPAFLLFLFIIQMWGPSPGILVSRNTTYLESHLGDDGMPRYVQYIDEKLSEGVTPENNAAVLFWRALWPSELRGQTLSQELICDALGMPIPDPAEGLVDVYGAPKIELAEWIKKNLLAEKIAAAEAHEAAEQAAYDAEMAGDEEDEEEVFLDEPAEYQPSVASFDSTADDMAQRTIGNAMARPWSTEEAPILAQWAKDNKQALDWLVEGSARPKYYSPSPNMLDGSDDSMIMMLLPGVQMLRSGARALLCRAMWHLGEGRVEESWTDIKACHQMSRHAAKGWTLVELLVAIAIDQMASTCTQALLHHGDLTVEQARMILKDLESLPALPDASSAIGEGERLAYLDMVTRIGSGRMNSGEDIQSMIGVGGDNSITSAVAATKIDWNIALERGNEWYDRMTESAKLPRLERIAVEEEIDNDLQNLSVQNNPSRIVGSLVSSKARSEVVADLMITLFLPAISACNEASDRSQAFCSMNRIAAALAVFRAEKGEYPESLDELAGILPSVPEGGVEPLDIYSGKPFIYKKDGEGYLLYSVFRNNVDDGGTSMGGEIVNGKRVEGNSPADQMKSDLVILMPLPEFRIAPPDD